MGRKRATGAQRPFMYWVTYSYKDKNGNQIKKRVQRWKVCLALGKNEHGKPVYKTFTGKTAKECNDKLKAARSELREYGTVSKKSVVTLRRYVALFLEAAEHRVSPSSLAGYRTKLETCCADWMNVDIRNFVPSTIQSIINGCGKSLSYKHTLWSALNQVFDMAVSDRVIMSNPAKSVQLSGMSLVETGRKAYSVPELKSMLLATLDEPIWLAARKWWRIFTGMRQGEILGAPLECLHLASRDDESRGVGSWFDLEWSLAEIPKKHGCGQPVKGVYPCGMKRGGNCPQGEWAVPDGFKMRHLVNRWCLKSTKSKKGRLVPIVPELAEVLRRYLDAMQDWPNPYGLLFRNADGSPITPKQDSVEFKQWLERAGLDPSTRFGHETRYSAVTLMRRGGGDQKAVEEIIGHTSIRVDNIYRTVDMEEKQQTVGLISAALDMPRGLLPSAQGHDIEDAEESLSKLKESQRLEKRERDRQRRNKKNAEE